MSGIGFNTKQMREDVKKVIDGMSKTFRQAVNNRKLTAEKRKEIQGVREEINRSHAKQAEEIRKSMSKEQREVAKTVEKNLEKARNNLADLELDLQEVEKAIQQTEEMARITTGQERAKLFEEIDRLKNEKIETLKKVEEARERVESTKREIDEIIRSVSDEININHDIINNDIHDYANRLLDKASEMMSFDPYCDNGYTLAMIEIVRIIETMSIERYDRTMNQLKKVDDWLRECDVKVNHGISSYTIIDTIKKKLQAEFTGKNGCKNFKLVGDPMSGVVITMTFADCITTIKMSPDGEGGIDSYLTNETPGVTDKKVHDEICERYCRIISEKACLNLDYEEQSLSPKEMTEVNKIKPVPARERAKVAGNTLRERISKNG